MLKHIFLLGSVFGSLRENENTVFVNEEFDAWCENWGYSLDEGSLNIVRLFNFPRSFMLSFICK